MRYLAVLGRQPEISLAELKALFTRVFIVTPKIASFLTNEQPNIDRLGGSLKIAVELKVSPLKYLENLPKGKITLGLSDYSQQSSARFIVGEALKLKRILAKKGRSIRVVVNHQTAVLSTATTWHNRLYGIYSNKIELLFVDGKWWKVIGVQNIDAYRERDQARPARDAKVGMLPPKLAQILINLCGPLPRSARILDPFCGTGVVLQEAGLMGYQIYGTDVDPRMVEYTKRNLKWLKLTGEVRLGDVTSFKWQGNIDAVVCESYLGQPMSTIPKTVKLKNEQQVCSQIILKGLKNLATQLKTNTPVVMAIPAWLRPDGDYEHLKIIDEIKSLGYNVENKTHKGLLYCRQGQIVAREIIILRKKTCQK